MFGSLGAMEIGLILAVVVLLFGVGKISGLGRDLGTSIKEFRRAVKDEDADEKKLGATTTPQVPPAASTQQPQPPQDKQKSNLF
jgi:sec-independent protein translocase protein TatA